MESCVLAVAALNAPLLRLLLALAILTFATPAAALPPGQPIVIGTGYDLPSKLLGDTRRLNVWLPDG